ncbi:alpha/beta hydrolase [Sphingobium sp. SA916]|uniref:alpha/beta hydrolase n=1 Tax=Sphingobium sp. SA916 TaxID=1851207 RepID=UPI000C9EEF0C|nr:alpha/beta fold hydrolase [Sphingobium sp. SA916]PNP97993.1 hypothetical protein A8G00_21260 [Sphingobium sp. SA916]
MKVSEVQFRSGEDFCAATLYEPNDLAAGERRPGVVMGHGFALVKEALAVSAEYLVRAGYVAVAIDYRRWGKSGGEPRRLLRPLDEVEDFRNGISFLQSCESVDPERIAIWGVSFGGGVVLQTAAVDRRVRCVVSQSPALNGRLCQRELRGMPRYMEMLERLRLDWERRFRGEEGERVPAMGPLTDESFPVIPSNAAPDYWTRYPSFKNDILLESLEHMLIWAPESMIDLIAPTPMLIVTNGLLDLHHPLDKIQDAFRRAGEPKKLVILPYDVRGLYEDPGMGEAMAEAISWFGRYL